jgi:hypothetical protein
MEGHLYCVRRLLLLGAERVDERGCAVLHEALKLGDPFDEGEIRDRERKARSVYLIGEPDEAANRLEEAIASCTASTARRRNRLGNTPGRKTLRVGKHSGSENTPALAFRDPCPSPDRGLERADRSRQPDHQGCEVSPSWLPQLLELPTAPTTRCQRHVAHSSDDENPRSTSQVDHGGAS